MRRGEVGFVQRSPLASEDFLKRIFWFGEAGCGAVGSGPVRSGSFNETLSQARVSLNESTVRCGQAKVRFGEVGSGKVG